jgi:parallel beta-helix repeat protein
MAFCLALLSLIARFKISVRAQAYDLTVDPSSEGPNIFKTIQDAIDNASSGQTIFVVNGTYYETLLINKRISLVGQSRDNTTIDGSQLSNVISITADNVKVKEFHLRNSSTTKGAAIRMDRANNNFISENIISDSYQGIYLSSSNNNTIEGNTLVNNDYCVEIFSSSNNVVSSNTMTSSLEGVGIFTSSSNVVSNNTMTSNINDGIGIYTSSNNMVKNNIISDNSYGLILSTSNNNAITGNSIYSSTSFGVNIASGSSNNILYHNNFDNAQQVEPDTSLMLPNMWDLNGEGNYWSDYNGTDSDADGIGDTQYKIDFRNRDNDPLMGLYSEHYFQFQDRSFRVDFVSNSTITNFEFEIGSETGNRIIRFDAAGQEETGFFCRARVPNSPMNYSSILLVDEEEISPKTLTSFDADYSSLYFSYAHSNRTVSLISSKTLYLLNQLMQKYSQLQATIDGQNNTYNVLVYNYKNLSDSYSQLKKAYDSLLLAQSENKNNNQSLIYIVAATTAVFLASTVYLSKRAHEKPPEPS